MRIEHTNSLLKNRWRILRDKLPMTRTDLIPFYVDCCCILYNICLMGEDELPLISQITEIDYNELEYLEPNAQQRK